jgi:hypothetical protein
MSYRIPFARRTGWPLNTNPFMARLERLKKQGVSVLDLTESNPTRCRFQYPAGEITGAFNNDANMIYEPSARGMLPAREAVVSYYRRKNLSVDPENIFLTSSTSEGYSFLFRLLCDPGQDVLVPSPSYPLFELLTDINDIRIVPYPLVYREGWSVDAQALEKAVTAQSKAVIVVNPNNPTGSFLKKNELTAINRLCRERGMAFICDEVFSDYPLEDDPHRVSSLAGNTEALTFVLNGISKNLGLPQMKIGWVLANGPERLLKAAVDRLEIIVDTYLSVGTPAQNALGGWLGLQPLIQKEITARLQHNYAFLKEEAQAGDPAFELFVSEGGWYAILRLAAQADESEFVQRLLEKEHVFVHPGYFFDMEGGSFIVLSLLTETSVFREGLRRIKSCKPTAI